MFDNLGLWLPQEAIKERDYLERVNSLLKNPTIHSRSDGTFYITDTFLGMYINISQKGISLKGSVCKSYFGNNCDTLTRESTKNAIQQLEDNLILPIRQAKVTKIEFGENLIVDSNPESYYLYLGESRHFKRQPMLKSLYYQNSLRQLIFYDKKLESKSKRIVLPPIWADKHVLRYELVYLSRLPLQFNRAEIQAQDLYTEVFYIDMIDRWTKEYFNISKLKEIELNYNTMKQPKDFFNQMLLLKLNEVGQTNLMALIEEMKAKKVFKHSEYYSLLKAKIKKMCNANLNSDRPELIKELDKKVMQIKEYCR